MNKIDILLIAIPSLLIVCAIVLWLWRRRRPLKLERFQLKWRDIQKLCANRDEWSKAVLDADHLLDEALKRKHIGGKNMGERLVKAQRIFTDNDGAWFGHKLRNKIEADPDLKLKENEVKDALIGIRQALKDLGALPK